MISTHGRSIRGSKKIGDDGGRKEDKDKVKAEVKVETNQEGLEKRTNL